jgi:hypothetical protein
MQTLDRVDFVYDAHATDNYSLCQELPYILGLVKVKLYKL